VRWIRAGAAVSRQERRVDMGPNEAYVELKVRKIVDRTVVFPVLT